MSDQDNAEKSGLNQVMMHFIRRQIIEGMSEALGEIPPRGKKEEPSIAERIIKRIEVSAATKGALRGTARAVAGSSLGQTIANAVGKTAAGAAAKRVAGTALGPIGAVAADLFYPKEMGSSEFERQADQSEEFRLARERWTRESEERERQRIREQRRAAMEAGNVGRGW